MTVQRAVKELNHMGRCRQRASSSGMNWINPLSLSGMREVIDAIDSSSVLAEDLLTKSGYVVFCLIADKLEENF